MRHDRTIRGRRPRPLLRHVAALAAVVVLLAGHGIVLRIVASHARLSLAIVLALGGVIAINHLGLVGLGYRVFRRRLRRGR